MKKTLLHKTMLLLCALIVGSSSVWATLPETPKWVATALSSISDNATVIIISNSTTATNIALPSTTTSSSPAKKACTVSTTSDDITTITPPSGTTLQDLAWTLKKTDTGVKFYQEGSSDIRLYLGATNSNTALKVGNTSSSNDVFVLGNLGKLLKVTTAARYVGPYDNSGSDWRTYNTEDATNYKGAALTFYVLTSAERTDPTITFNNGSVRVDRTLNLSSLFSSNSTGAVTYSITAGSDYASIDGNNLTGVAVGSVTVQASQAATSSYKAATATATITVQAAKTPSSIAVTTAPTKTAYTEGETFDPTGMVVTATYGDSSTEDVTASCTFSPDGVLNKSNTTITISYTENGTTKTTTQAITVAEKQSNDFVKVTDASTLRAGDQFLLVYETGNLALATINSGGKYYESADVTINEGVISDPTGVAVLTLGGEEGAWTINSSLSGNYLSLTSSSNELREAEAVGNNDTENWTINYDDDDECIKIINNAYPLDKNNNNRYIQWNKSSGSERFACYGGTQQNLQLYRVSKSVTITDAEYATYCGNAALNFDGVGITAFTATDGETSVKLNKITSGKVPANTPVVLYKEGLSTTTTFDVPVAASADAISGTNNLHVVGEGGLTGEDNIFVLAKKNDVVGFYLWDKTKTLNEGKIYLQGNGTTARSFLGFEEGETTAIEELKDSNEELKSWYNLAGQHVAQPTKGLYILNGRKVVIK